MFFVKFFCGLVYYICNINRSGAEDTEEEKREKRGRAIRGETPDLLPQIAFSPFASWRWSESFERLLCAR